jgi:hypothetical protein
VQVRIFEKGEEGTSTGLGREILTTTVDEDAVTQVCWTLGNIRRPLMGTESYKS